MRTITVSGTVQGVGFRPFVFVLATELNLSGYVRNSGGAVEIVIDGPPELLEQFVVRLQAEIPPLANIDKMSIADSEQAFAKRTFEILASETKLRGPMAVPPDTATCLSCLAELFDSSDRRYLYPFTNCTACGPRFTIIEKLPYDRIVTTMRDFRMCHRCTEEFENPRNRRFHAQPNACWDCGPSIWFSEVPNASAPKSVTRQEQLLTFEDAICRLQAGKILAIKGLGGFHLVCDARNEEAVAQLRKRKVREEKPFAVMFADEVQLREYAVLSDDATKLLNGPQRPIVVLPNRHDGARKQLAPHVSGQLDSIGAMLPYTPLQHVLLKRLAGPLVMTSANISDEPICMDNSEAASRLKDIADGFVFHNRDISTRFDDSVFRSVEKHSIPLRRSRGYAPAPITLPVSLSKAILSLGAQLKSTFCIGRERHGYLSQHLGDMSTPEVLEFFYETLSKFQSLFELSPDAIVHDNHPGYLSTQLAAQLAFERGLIRIGVQHHHAHIVSCMVEHGLQGKVLGVALDGTGYGDDGTVWGGEFLITDYKVYRRVGHFMPVQMPGNEAAIKRPARMLAGYLRKMGDSRGASIIKDKLSTLLSPSELSAIEQQLKRNFNSPITSSCGRLFDAAAVLIGVEATPTYEGQCAATLESLAWRCGSTAQPCESFAERNEHGLLQINGPAMLERVASLMETDTQQEVAAAFHHMLSASIADACRQLAEQHGINRVCLSGGVFQNELILHLLVEALESMKLLPYFHRQVPPNDGGLALGQMVVGASILGFAEIS